MYCYFSNRPYILKINSDGFAGIAGDQAGERGTGRVIQIIHIYRAVGIRGIRVKEEIHACIFGISAVLEEKFLNPTGLAGNDRGVVARYVGAGSEGCIKI